MRRFPAGLTIVQAAQKIPELKLPAVWFPYRKMGMSSTDVLCDTTAGRFGPFAGQLFVGDQTNASVMRVALEQVAGEYQGACFPFRKDLDCGVNRMCFGQDGSMFVGLTNRSYVDRLHTRRWPLVPADETQAATHVAIQ